MSTLSERNQQTIQDLKAKIAAREAEEPKPTQDSGDGAETPPGPVSGDSEATPDPALYPDDRGAA